MFSLTVLGTNGLYPDKINPTTGYLVRTDKTSVLVDVGSGVFNNLSAIMPPENLDAVIITHYHFDHVSDIGVLSYYLQTKDADLTVYGPDADMTMRRLISDTPHLIFRPIEERILKIGDLSVNFYKMNHPVPTYGVSFICDEKKLAITSDTNYTDSFDDLLTGADLAVIHSGFLDKDWNEKKPLLSAKQVGLIGKKYGIKILLSHINPTIGRSGIYTEAKSVYDNCFLAEYKKYVL